jgi:hypothetical protein
VKNMSTLQEIIDLEKWLGGKIGDTYKKAVAIKEPGGTSDDWDNLLSHFKVTPVAKEEKSKSIMATGQKRGASVEEVYEVLISVVKSATKKFKNIKRPWDDDKLEKRWDKLRELIDEIHAKTMKAYKKLVIPKRSMFSFAKEAAENSEGVVTFDSDEGYVMCCDGCGAPRLKTTDFECAFCGSDFAE